MKRTKAVRPALLAGVLAVLVVAISFSTRGEEAPPVFVAHYQLGESADFGDDLRVAIKIRLFNRGTADASDAAVTLERSAVPGDACHTFSGVWVPAGESAFLYGWVTVPRTVFDSWQRGSAPNLYVAFSDSQGRALLAPVAMEPMPVQEEE